jgi:hypothetical protein
VQVGEHGNAHRFGQRPSDGNRFFDYDQTGWFEPEGSCTESEECATNGNCRPVPEAAA